MDAIHYKVREDKQVVIKAAYVVIGVNLDGEKEAIYKVVETNEVYGGDELMYVGLYIGELLGDYQSRVWTIEKI